MFTFLVFFVFWCALQIKSCLSRRAAHMEVAVDDAADAAICVICLDVLHAADDPFALTLACGHSFHCVCVCEWFARQQNSTLKPDCPVCKAPVPDAFVVVRRGNSVALAATDTVSNGIQPVRPHVQRWVLDGRVFAVTNACIVLVVALSYMAVFLLLR